MTRDVIGRLAAQLGIRSDEVRVGDVVELASQRLSELTAKLDLMCSTLRHIETELQAAQRAADHARQTYVSELARMAHDEQARMAHEDGDEP